MRAPNIGGNATLKGMSSCISSPVLWGCLSSPTTHKIRRSSHYSLASLSSRMRRASLVLLLFSPVDTSTLIRRPVGPQPTDLIRGEGPGPMCGMGTGLRRCGRKFEVSLGLLSQSESLNGSEHQY